MVLEIMPLGDSITDGVIPGGSQTARWNAGGYRTDLWNRLSKSGLSVDFVGSLSTGPTTLADKDHEGHGGAGISTIANLVNQWLKAQQPDIITLMIGTNDMFDPAAGSTTSSRLSTLIDQITNSSPNANLLVASIPPFSNPSINQRVLAFNSALPDIVSSKSAQGKKVSFVDIFSKLTLSDLAEDGFHPNQAGYNKIAKAWDSAIRSVDSSKTPNVVTTKTVGNDMADLQANNQSDEAQDSSETPDVVTTETADNGLSDFNADNQSDILWRNRASGENVAWLMNGINPAQSVGITPVADVNWSIGGWGDFNADDKTDILWRNSATGDNTVWLMDGTNPVQDVATSPAADPNWSIGGTGDFNADDQTDILWRNTTTGENRVWLMDGTNLAQYVDLTSVTDLNWSMGGTGDYNADNKTDILWRNGASGENAVWLMDGTNVAQYVGLSPVTDLNWQIG